VSLRIFDLQGKLVNNLINEEQFSGIHSVVWQGNDDFGNYVSAGLYIVKLKIGKYSGQKRIALIR